MQGGMWGKMRRERRDSIVSLNRIEFEPIFTLPGGCMTTSRREFVALGSLGLLASALPAQVPDAQNPPVTPGAPTAFGTAPAVGPEVTAATLKEAEKLVQVEMTAKDLDQAAS